jgi:hypothetical protein
MMSNSCRQRPNQAMQPDRWPAYCLAVIYENISVAVHAHRSPVEDRPWRAVADFVSSGLKL